MGNSNTYVFDPLTSNCRKAKDKCMSVPLLARGFRKCFAKKGRSFDGKISGRIKGSIKC